MASRLNENSGNTAGSTGENGSDVNESADLSGGEGLIKGELGIGDAAGSDTLGRSAGFTHQTHSLLIPGGSRLCLAWASAGRTELLQAPTSSALACIGL
jgi:hypothetical protein